MVKTIRRVVTGTGPDGRSRVVFDGTPANRVAPPDWPSNRVTMLWASDTAPACNEGNADAATRTFHMMPRPGGSVCIFVEFAPLAELDAMTPEARKAATKMWGIPEEDTRPELHPGMHRTASLDYVIMLQGQVTLLLETGEVTLHAGDIVVDRGVFHAWENRGSEPALAVSVIVDAAMLGRGA